MPFKPRSDAGLKVTYRSAEIHNSGLGLAKALAATVKGKGRRYSYRAAIERIHKLVELLNRSW